MSLSKPSLSSSVDSGSTWIDEAGPAVSDRSVRRPSGSTMTVSPATADRRSECAPGAASWGRLRRRQPGDDVLQLAQAVPAVERGEQLRPMASDGF